jgi:peptidase M42 family hydrolase
MRPLQIEATDVVRILHDLLAIPSPTGYTDPIVHFVCDRLTALGVPFELTRRGAIRATLEGRNASPERAVVGHVDTLGAQVKSLKNNGRLEIVSIGTWSARFAEGARVTVFGERGPVRGTILPLKASGHTFNEEIDTQPVAWTNLEVRLDERVSTAQAVARLGIDIGDIIAVDPQPEVSDSGFINSRHLDDKAGVAAMLAALEAISTAALVPAIKCHFLFTISEEVGSGASAVLHGDVAELVAVDNSTPAPGQNSSEFGVTVAMGDSTGPFDYHLTHHLLGLARRFAIPHQRDVFRWYRCDAASAIEAGNDIRTALIAFGVDASHGYERTHVSSLVDLARLLTVYVQSPPSVARDRRHGLGPVEDFPDQPVE